MLKRVAAVSLLLITFCVSAMAQELTDPQEIISKTKDKLLSLNSYGFTIEKKGWDFNMAETAEATKSLTGEAAGSSLTKKFAGDVDEVDGSKPQWKTYTSEIMWMKPWVLRMKLVQNDYLPAILQGGVMRYNYAKDKDDWSINTASIPIALPRGIETESGNFLYSNWTLNVIDLVNLAKDLKPELVGVEDLNGRKTYKLRFDFTEKNPTTKTADLSAWQVPKELHFKVEPEVGWFVTNSDNIKEAFIYIDVDSFIITREEVYQSDGELYYDKVWKDLRLNNIDKKEITSKK